MKHRTQKELLELAKHYPEDGLSERDEAEIHEKMLFDERRESRDPMYKNQRKNK